MVVFLASACDCRGGPGVASRFGVLGVDVTDSAGITTATRDVTLDFGNAFVGETVRKVLTVRNGGTATLTLEGLAPSPNEAPFAFTFTAGTQVEPGQTTTLEVSFSPTSVAGAQQVFENLFTLTASGVRAEDNSARLTLRGTGVAGACTLPAALDFGKVPVGETFELAWVMKNPTSASGAGFVGALEGLDAMSFGFGAGSPNGDVTVAAGAQASVVFTFSPTEKRDYEASVRLKGPGPCAQGSVPVRGKGADDVLSWKPTSLNFGYVSTDGLGKKQVLFTNESLAPIRLTGITSTDPTQFTYAAAPGVTPTEFVIPGGSVDFPMDVLCRPTALGPLQGNLTFATGLVKAPLASIALDCFGGGPRISVKPKPVVSFGTVGWLAGTTAPSATRRIVVSNLGTVPSNGDVKGNLLLGQVGPAGPGQLPYLGLKALNATTDTSEFDVTVNSAYDPSTGLVANSPQFMTDLSVVLTPKTPGPKAATLTLYSNDPAESAIALQLTAEVVAAPPCNYTVGPTTLDFGLVTPPTSRELAVKVTNHGTGAQDVCYLSGIDVVPGSDGAFSLSPGQPSSLTIAPKGFALIAVRIASGSAVPSVLTSLSGALGFAVNSSSAPSVVVDLKATLGPSCLVVAPDVIDFGTVKKGCRSSARSFAVYNVCSTQVGLMEAGLDSATSAEFTLPSAPSIPPSGKILLPGATPESFQARYAPVDDGPDFGSVSLSVLQSGQPVTYRVTLKGTGDAFGVQTDTFTQDEKPQADILMVVDNSCSMANKQTSVADNFGAFVDYAVDAGVDWHIGVTTTDDDAEDCSFGSCTPAGLQGKLLRSATNPAVLTTKTPNVVQLFKDKVKVGTSGSPVEKPLSTSLKAVTAPLITGSNAGFLREDASLAIVAVTDTGDQSGQAASYYVSRFLNVKGATRPNMFTYNVIGAFLPSAPSGCTYDMPVDSSSLRAVMTQTKGLEGEICTTDWVKTLKALGQSAFGFRTSFFLSSTPDTSPGKSLEVKIGGATVPQASWSYDAVSNAVNFTPATTPGPGQTLTIRYGTSCL